MAVELAPDEPACMRCLCTLPTSLEDGTCTEQTGLHSWHVGGNSESCPEAVIHNIVSTSVIAGSHMPIDLQDLALLLPCSNYDRRRFAAITIRIDNPRCTSLLFTSGKLVITGVKTWYESLLASMCVAGLMNDFLVGKQYSVINCQIQNIVAHTDLQLRPPTTLDIQAMYEDMNVECTFQRHMFPGCIWRNPECPVVLLCFFSGRIVLTGGKTLQDIHRGWERLWPTVRRYIY